MHTSSGNKIHLCYAAPPHNLYITNLEKTARILPSIFVYVKEINQIFLKTNQSSIRSSFIPSTGQMGWNRVQTILITVILKIYFPHYYFELDKKKKNYQRKLVIYNVLQFSSVFL